MCNIWKVTGFEELPPDQYLKLPDSLRTINITGGEPFLRSDIVDVVRRVHEAAPKSRMVISSNGLLKERIAKSMAAIVSYHPRLGIGISIDGLDGVHDGIRGVEGGFTKAVETIKAVKAEGIKDIRIGMTIVKENCHQVLDVYKLSKELGVEFTTTVAHNSEIYFRKSDNNPREALPSSDGGLQRVVDDHLRSFLPKNWFRAYHLAGITDSAIRASAANICSAGSRFFFMDPRGDVYPCIVMNRTMGNIKDFENVETLLATKAAQNVRAMVKSCQQDCWMVCNTRSLIISHPGKSIGWVLKNKPRTHFSRSS
jgi:radical SAM protein with 4Fe4S-binding SPASM domain